jgi:hypothetical protein
LYSDFSLSNPMFNISLTFCKIFCKETSLDKYFLQDLFYKRSLYIFHFGLVVNKQ